MSMPLNYAYGIKDLDSIKMALLDSLEIGRCNLIVNWAMMIQIPQ